MLGELLKKAKPMIDSMLVLQVAAIDPSDLTFLATLGLAAATAVLVYVTYTLRKATDHLARSQILPRLALEIDPYYQTITQHLQIPLVNKGIGTAFGTKVFGIVPPNNMKVEAVLKVGRREISPLSAGGPRSGEESVFVIQGIVEGLDFMLEVQYEDSEGYRYTKRIPVRTPPRAT